MRMTNTTAYDVIILRGLPGSGKSTLSNKIVKSLGEKGIEVSIFSTDNYHIDPDGVYRFKVDKIGVFHKENKKAFLTWVQNETESRKNLMATDKFTPSVAIVDNTNLTEGEIAFYYDTAEIHGLSVAIHTVLCPPDVAFARNTHGIPETTFGYMVRALEEKPLPSWWVKTYNFEDIL